jgi:hypothetical protein
VSGLRPIAGSFIAAAPAGARVRTRLRVRPAYVVHRTGASQDRQRNVAHVRAAGRDAALLAGVGVPVYGQVGSRTVDGLSQEVAAQERVDLRRLAGQRVRDRGGG